MSTSTEAPNAGPVRRASTRLYAWIARPSFLWVTTAIYVMVGIYFSVIVRWGSLTTLDSGVEAIGSNGIVPDEDRHIGRILFYADRGWWQGPFVSDMDERQLVLGEIERNPSYLYHWVMSIIVSVVRLAGGNYDATVITLRIVGVLIGAFGLWVVWRMLLLAGFSARIAAVSVFALSLTGRYMWQGAAVSYDIASAVLFFLFLYSALLLLRGGGIRHLAYAGLWAALASITKYTFVPFVGLGLVILIVLYVRQVRADGPGSFARRWRDEVRDAPVRLWVGVGAVVIAAVLFVERIVVNVIVYRALEPSCASVHSDAACSVFAIYRRNSTARANYLQSLADGGTPAQFSPFEYTGEWLDRYYTSLFFYAGRTSSFQISPFTYVLMALILIVIVVLILNNRTALLPSLPVRFVVLIAGIYTVGTFLVNLNTYLRYDVYFAHQGRYLLPAVPIIYALLLRLVAVNWPRVTGRWRAIVGVPVGLLFAVAALVHVHLIAFFSYAHSYGWFSPLHLALANKLASLFD